MKFICRTTIIRFSSVFLISSAVFASSNPQSNCSDGGSQSECTTYGRKPLTELQLMQISQMNAQAAAAEAQRGLAAQQSALREQMRIQAEAERARTRPERVKECEKQTMSGYASCSNSGISAYKGHMSYCNYLFATAAASGTVAAGAVLFAGASTLPTAGTGTLAGGTVAGVAGVVAAGSGGAGAICSNQANTNLVEKQSQCDVNKAQAELACANLQ